MKNDVRLQRRLSRPWAERSQIVKEWRRSGLSVRAFAKKRGVAAGSLWGWAARLDSKRHRETHRGGAIRDGHKFLAVEVAQTNASSTPPGRGDIEIAWPGGPVVRVIGDVRASTLAAVMHVVAEVRRC